MTVPRNSIGRVYQYYFDEPAYQEDVERSMREFFDLPRFPKVGIPQGTDMTPGFYNEWFLYDFAFDKEGSTLAHFVRTNPLSLGEEEMRFYRDLLDNYFGLFEIRAVRPLEGATLYLLPGGPEFAVQEFSGTMDMKVGDGAFGRVARVGDHYELVGADSFMVPISDPSAAPFVDKLLSRKCLTPKDVHLILLTGEVPADGNAQGESGRS